MCFKWKCVNYFVDNTTTSFQVYIMLNRGAFSSNKHQKQEICDRNIEGVDHSLTNSVPRHNSLLPNTIRALLDGPSNCGKTNVMLSLIESLNGLKFENIYVLSKSLY